MNVAAEIWAIIQRECGAIDYRSADAFAEWLRCAEARGDGELRLMPPHRPCWRLYYCARDGLWVVPYPEYAPTAEREAEATHITEAIRGVYQRGGAV